MTVSISRPISMHYYEFVLRNFIYRRVSRECFEKFFLHPVVGVIGYEAGKFQHHSSTVQCSMYNVAFTMCVSISKPISMHYY